ncbi:MAG: hypothetical protein KKH97_03265 [Proteobacteria bacterium]|nr:hypothetical protein [Pseudomonadota bacterium]MBU1713754.1 hypothetical protein [Pseudomonadota bacterium]
MVRKKGKSISFDAMVKFFMMNYDIPSRKDIQKVLIRLDNLETLIRNSGMFQKGGRFVTGEGKGRNIRSVKTAFEIVYDAIKSFENGADFAEIQAKTGFGEKKIRNIIFRLNKFGRIKRKNRGVYIAV